jgi:hypothetical protein
MDGEMWFLQKIGIITDFSFHFPFGCFFCAVVKLTEHLRNDVEKTSCRNADCTVIRRKGRRTCLCDCQYSSPTPDHMQVCLQVSVLPSSNKALSKSKLKQCPSHLHKHLHFGLFSSTFPFSTFPSSAFPLSRSFSSAVLDRGFSRITVV